ncbi:hypothetical protein G7K_6798-t1 [Saitoella complicata NRRL Y-17804]|uniref:Uncharacterized protein n=1 Tax=Saitoella complicata (strain BCRC 22490 / CBS 7301 / JCM 7358 / NBRC 10748 / NRRL Y-17804) TaxID=698492 RepID=A0A0E9NSH7_SAICN|nr:hypothetical protein G7K_6798-t1 [Saitoella complicata NRRL Y-17804]
MITCFGGHYPAGRGVAQSSFITEPPLSVSNSLIRCPEMLRDTAGLPFSCMSILPPTIKVHVALPTLFPLNLVTTRHMHLGVHGAGGAGAGAPPNPLTNVGTTLLFFFSGSFASPSSFSFASFFSTTAGPVGTSGTDTDTDTGTPATILELELVLLGLSGTGTLGLPPALPTSLPLCLLPIPTSPGPGCTSPNSPSPNTKTLAYPSPLTATTHLPSPLHAKSVKPA